MFTTYKAEEAAGHKVLLTSALPSRIGFLEQAVKSTPKSSFR